MGGGISQYYQNEFLGFKWFVYGKVQKVDSVIAFLYNHKSKCDWWMHF